MFGSLSVFHMGNLAAVVFIWVKPTKLGGFRIDGLQFWNVCNVNNAEVCDLRYYYFIALHFTFKIVSLFIYNLQIF